MKNDSIKSESPSVYDTDLPFEYISFIKRADSLYLAEDYVQAAASFSSAFKSIGWKATYKDRYNSACSWALAGNNDSAFSQLNNIAVSWWEECNFKDIVNEKDFISLQNDNRWKPLLNALKKNEERQNRIANNEVAKLLNEIYNYDQKERLLLEDTIRKYGDMSVQVNKLWDVIKNNDSINLRHVKAILDKYGWLGDEEVGSKGNQTLFLVIQHADITTQEKYLPMMKEAVKNGKANAANLAYLIDRIEIRNGRPQIYGSQLISMNGITKLLPLVDSINVNKRRAEVGLPPLEEYLTRFATYQPYEKFGKQ